MYYQITMQNCSSKTGQLSYKTKQLYYQIQATVLLKTNYEKIVLAKPSNCTIQSTQLYYPIQATALLNNNYEKIVLTKPSNCP